MHQDTKRLKKTFRNHRLQGATGSMKDLFRSTTGDLKKMFEEWLERKKK